MDYLGDSCDTPMPADGPPTQMPPPPASGSLSRERELMAEVARLKERVTDLRLARDTVTEAHASLESQLREAEARVTELEEKWRAVWCVWCGEGIAYKVGDDVPAAHARMKEHDQTCPKNPLVIALAKAQPVADEATKLIRYECSKHERSDEGCERCRHEVLCNNRMLREFVDAYEPIP